ncbi:MAG: hypothetical protein HC895_03945 [Leptolyngbyaceae cyanobacterium SM1_3_5]|nr:hypothetical protein [Leptolyngbyaceae cyanobacterium SM1_3_5]
MTSVDLEKPFRDVQDSKDLVCKVFLVFSRFEFALKRSGYAKQQDYLKVDRACFVRKHSNSLLPSPLPQDLLYLRNNPPKKQKLENNCLEWQDHEPAPNDLTLKWLLDAAYTVRNNLFHGGKWTICY